MAFADLTLARYSCREYQARQIEQEKLDAIIEAGRIAPSACNNHPARVLVCDTPELLASAGQGRQALRTRRERLRRPGRALGMRQDRRRLDP